MAEARRLGICYNRYSRKWINKRTGGYHEIIKTCYKNDSCLHRGHCSCGSFLFLYDLAPDEDLPLEKPVTLTEAEVIYDDGTRKKLNIGEIQLYPAKDGSEGKTEKIEVPGDDFFEVCSWLKERSEEK